MAVIKLSEVQLAILTIASKRRDGSALPRSGRVANQATGVRRALPALLKSGLLAEITTSESAKAWRQDGSSLFGLAITPAGRALISDDSVKIAAKTISKAVKSRATEPAALISDTPPAIAPVSAAQTKIASVLAMLRQEGGATSQDLIAVTGWLPHTIRAAVTRLRKKGHDIRRIDRDAVTAYVVASGE